MSPRDSFGAEEEQRFQVEEAEGTPLLDAVQQLCQDTDRSLESMETLTHQQLGELALQTYPDNLPEFWRVWIDWHRPRPTPPMGDL